jgi:pimeloyl-ACP methyl ester carboxylesterase
MTTEVYRTCAGRRTVEDSYRAHLRRWTVPRREHTVGTREGETFVLDCGPTDAPPVVALHGAGSNSAIWRSEAERWSATNRLYLVDVVGEPGLSAPSRPPLDSDAHAAWLADVLDGLGVAACALVGVSLGGWLAADFAIRRPGRVERLALRAPGGIGRQRYGAVLAASVLMPFGDRGTRRALRIALGPGDIPDPVIDYMLTIHRNFRPRRDTLPIFSDEQLRSLTVPMHVVLGARDRMLDADETAARLARLCPAASVTVVPGTGHGLLDDGACLHEFLRGGDRV